MAIGRKYDRDAVLKKRRRSRALPQERIFERKVAAEAI